jgi:hypothetical protein
MCERRRRLDHSEVESELAEKRRRGRERMDRGADVVPESRKRQLGGARAAADRVPSFEDEDGAAGLGQRERGGEPVRAGADDDGV